MSAEGVMKFIAAVELHYPRPKFSGDESMEGAWVASMVRTLGGYPDKILSAAAERILTERDPKKDGRFFPVPKECTDVCEEAARRLALTETPLLTAPEMSYEAKVRLARDLMQAPMSQTAVREGWGPTLFHFIVRNGRVPGGREVDECRQEAKQFAAEYQRCLKGNHPFGRPLARLAESMTKKARELMEIR